MNHPFIMWQSHSNPDALGSHSEQIYACISAHAAMQHCQLVLEVLINGLITRSSCEIVRISNTAHITELTQLQLHKSCDAHMSLPIDLRPTLPSHEREAVKPTIHLIQTRLSHLKLEIKALYNWNRHQNRPTYVNTHDKIFI